MKSPLVIHQADWVVPVAAPVIRHGAVATAAGRIVATGSLEDVTRLSTAAQLVHHPGSILLPRLVNAHTHLELSHLSHLGCAAPPESFPSWIQTLLAARRTSPTPLAEIIACGRAILRDQYAQGVIAVADTGNLLQSAAIGHDFPGHYLFFHEYLGFTPAAARLQLAEVATRSPALCCVAHAPYSCHAALITALKKRARELALPFSLHVAETTGENELIRCGTGPLRSFLEQMGVWNEAFHPLGIDNFGSLGYLHQLGVLDNKTICVHCVHLSEEEIALLIHSRAKVCLCPGSNGFLKVGDAPVERLVRGSVLPALGTDSLASNPVLSLWREMGLLRKNYPQLTAATIVAMATRGGAEALGLAHDYGTLEPGKVAAMLAVSGGGQLTSAAEVLEFLVAADGPRYPILL